MIEFKRIASLFEKHGWPAVKTITPIEGGNVNPAYNINDQWVVRLNRRDPSQRKFQRESLAMGHLKGLVPVPKVLGLDESKSVLDVDVLVTEKMPGQSISSYWATLSTKQQRDLAYQAGVTLACIHSVTLEQSGPLEEPSSRSWTETLARDLENHWREALERELFDPQLDAELWRYFRVLRPEFDQIKSPSLLHGDFHFSNVLGQDTHLTGVIDFEWAKAGDPAMDFCNASNIQSSAPGSEAWMTEGYRSIQSEFEPNSRRVKFYALMSMIELASISQKHWLGKVQGGEKNHASILGTFHRLFEELKHQT